MLRLKLIHLIHMYCNADYRQEHERRARFAHIMVTNKSIVEGKVTK